jgi:hypothetical protein
MEHSKFCCSGLNLSGYGRKSSGGIAKVRGKNLRFSSLTVFLIVSKE